MPIALHPASHTRPQPQPQPQPQPHPQPQPQPAPTIADVPPSEWMVESAIHSSPGACQALYMQLLNTARTPPMSLNGHDAVRAVQRAMVTERCHHLINSAAKCRRSENLRCELHRRTQGAFANVHAENTSHIDQQQAREALLSTQHEQERTFSENLTRRNWCTNHLIDARAYVAHSRSRIQQTMFN
jgi:hypothetical protein